MTDVPQLKNHCQKCGIKFSLLFRKHKCKVCALSFCHKCSLNKTKIPQFGHQDEVRVCDVCHQDLVRLSIKPAETKVVNEIPSSRTTMTNKEEKVKDDEDDQGQLELAISLSLEEHRRLRGIQVYEEQELTVVKAISLAEMQQQIHSNVSSPVTMNYMKSIEEVTDSEDAGFYENY